RLEEAMRQLPQLEDVTNDQQAGGLQTVLSIDRDAAARLGVTTAAIDEALYDAFGQRLVSTIFTQSAQYRVVLEVDELYRRSPAALDHIYVRAASTDMIPLGSLVTATQQAGLLSIERLGQFPATTVSFNLAPGVALSDAVDAIAQAQAQLDMPVTVEMKFQGAARAFEASLASTLWLMLAAVAAMYIVLGILYESYIHPVTILSTLPSRSEEHTS